MYMASQHVDGVKPKSVSAVVGVRREKLGCGHKDRALSDWQDHEWISGRESSGSSLGSLPTPGILKLSGSCVQGHSPISGSEGGVQLWFLVSCVGHSPPFCTCAA